MTRPRPAHDPAVPGADDLEDIQGLVYSAWTDHPYAGFVFATWDPQC